MSGAFNIASGTQIEILDLAKRINQCLPEPVAIEFGPTRMGDVLHSLANVQAAQASFGFNPVKRIDTGLPEYVAWAQKILKIRKDRKMASVLRKNSTYYRWYRLIR